MDLHAPSMWLFVLSVLIAVLAIVSTFTPIEYVTKYAFWVAIIAFIVLAFGNLVLNFINTVTYFPGANRRELSHFFLGGSTELCRGRALIPSN